MTKFCFVFAALLLSQSACYSEELSKDLIARLRSNEAIKGYREFQMAKRHRAFAVSKDGPWGWSSDAYSAQIAAEDAVTTCTGHLSASAKSDPANKCQVLDIDGVIQQSNAK